MRDSTRCLFNDSFDRFICADNNALLGVLCDKYRGEALTTTKEAYRISKIMLTRKSRHGYLRSGWGLE